MPSYTSERLLSSIRARITIPAAQNLFTDTNLLLLANDELRTVILPMIMQLHSEFFVYSKDYQLDGTTVSFDIPPESIGSNLRDVTIVTQSGTAGTLDSEYSIPMISQELRTETSPWPMTYYGDTGFFLRNNSVVLNTATIQGDALRLYYFRRPNEIVEVADAGQVLSIDTVNNLVVLANVPPGWEAGNSVCVVSNTPGFDLLVESTSLVSVSSPTVCLSASAIAEIRVGDWIALEGETPIPQIPVEAHPVLAQATAVKVVEALGDQAGFTVAQNKYDQIARGYTMMTNSRVEGEPKRLVTRRGIQDSIVGGWRGGRGRAF